MSETIVEQVNIRKHSPVQPGARLIKLRDFLAHLTPIHVQGNQIWALGSRSQETLNAY